uniref:Uncharacterized protein n=1 Tax=Lepeophtheirus salmonis TaxID=72036 RepID=A0A0K2TF21_LEPSM
MVEIIVSVHFLFKYMSVICNNCFENLYVLVSKEHFIFIEISHSRDFIYLSCKDSLIFLTFDFTSIRTLLIVGIKILTKCSLLANMFIFKIGLINSQGL